MSATLVKLRDEWFEYADVLVDVMIGYACNVQCDYCSITDEMRKENMALAPVMAALAKSHLAEVGTVLLKTATEVHGGIGFTDEYDLHFFFKRVALDRQLLGSPDQMRERAARLQGWVATS